MTVPETGWMGGPVISSRAQAVAEARAASERATAARRAAAGRRMRRMTDGERNSVSAGTSACGGRAM